LPSGEDDVHRLILQQCAIDDKSRIEGGDPGAPERLWFPGPEPQREAVDKPDNDSTQQASDAMEDQDRIPQQPIGNPAVMIG